MAEPGTPLSIGERVAFYRRQRRLTQHGLAQRLNRSVGWVRNIEQGRRQVDSTRVILELADTLDVEPNKLTGRPLFPPPSGPKMPQPSGVVADLRRVLLHHDAIHGLDSNGQPLRLVAELEREVARAEHLYRSEPRNFSAVVWVLPALIRDARHVTRHAGEHTAERRAAFGVLARLYALTAGALWQWGDDDLCWIAADRSITAAEHTGDPTLIVVGIRAMQLPALAKGHLGDVVELVDAVAGTITPRIDTPAEQLVLVGGAQLAGAFAAARAKDRAEHARLRRLAEQSAAWLRSDRLVYGKTFGPGDVALQHVGELVELEEPARALRLAERLPADPMPQMNRRAFHRIHQAKAHFLQRKDRETTELLMQAWEIAPELTPNEQMTAEMVRAMVERARYRYNPHLRTLAERLGIA